MSPMLTIAKREFRSYFDAPLAYVVICLSFFGLGLFFFMSSDGFWQLGRATLEPLFRYVPAGLAMLVVPVITMRLMAEEKRSSARPCLSYSSRNAPVSPAARRAMRSESSLSFFM